MANVPSKSRLILALLCAVLLSGCSDFGHYVSAMDINGGVSGDPDNPQDARVTVGGKIYFRDPTPIKPKKRKLPNYSKDK